jgi:hypothetical protein
MLRSGAELADVELVGGSDLGRGHGRRMERGHNGRRVYGRGWRREGRDLSREQGQHRRRQNPSRELGRTACIRLADGVLRAGSVAQAGGIGGSVLNGGTTQQKHYRLI